MLDFYVDYSLRLGPMALSYCINTTSTLLAAVFKMASVDRAVECVVSNSDADELVNS